MISYVFQELTGMVAERKKPFIALLIYITMKMKLTYYLLNFKLQKLSSAEPPVYGGFDYIACDHTQENIFGGKKNIWKEK